MNQDLQLLISYNARGRNQNNSPHFLGKRWDKYQVYMKSTKEYCHEYFSNYLIIDYKA